MADDAAPELLRISSATEDANGGERVVLSLEGDLDLSMVEEFESAVHGLPDDIKAVVLDLTALRFVDSSGIHAIVRTHGALEAAGTECRVRIEPGSGVEEVLEMSGILRHLNLDRSTAE